MYAVIEQGGKQYKVKQGDVIKIELADVASDAKKIEIDKVLLVGEGKTAKIGTPYVEGAKVTGKFADTATDSIVKGRKLYPTHFKRRKASKRRIGHRQKYMEVTIEKIKA
ncbi:MAG: 50S ribosomal protein L21 [Planctomycetes bacterium]|nr:50S ribosomal protein L21 [Planctomycetota bacterium]MBU1517619.1 50S ribosomal protein L21 [Planctomycetota bacterium]MBU2457317.1 50S ribosomal protein L21 [Planctomycetota bacterium]